MQNQWSVLMANTPSPKINDLLTERRYPGSSLSVDIMHSFGVCQHWRWIPVVEIEKLCVLGGWFLDVYMPVNFLTEPQALSLMVIQMTPARLWMEASMTKILVGRGTEKGTPWHTWSGSFPSTKRERTSWRTMARMSMQCFLGRYTDWFEPPLHGVQVKSG